MRRFLITVFVTLGVFGLFLEQYRNQSGYGHWLLIFIDYSLLSYLVGDYLLSTIKSKNTGLYIRRSLFQFIFLILYLSLFLFNIIIKNRLPELGQDNNLITLIRSFLLIMKVFGRMRQMSNYVHSIITKPAQTVVMSFFILILAGALVLMMPVMSVSEPLTPIDALFTATSAVCVTGLIVMDTASRFSYPGKIVLMLLIQAGGLGIMLLSFFMVFLFKQNLSVKDRNLLSYMLSSQSTASLKQNVIRIIKLTFLIESVGLIVLLPRFIHYEQNLAKALFFSMFHSVSAFCNAGFSLYTDSLMSMNGDFVVNLAIAALIICGGISFAVLGDLTSLFSGLFRKSRHELSINSKIVLLGTSTLIIGGMLIFYGLEHRENLYPQALSQQYLSAFFQSVTLRTAGFNTLPFEKFSNATLLIMMGIMFIGGASGSTAGGIKVNTIGVVWAYIRSFRKGHQEILLYKHQLPKDSILQAFTVIVFAVFSLFIITSILFISEEAPPVALLFESVSAFATVGLSTGITPDLSVIGKTGIILLMFLGRLGPLTLLTASAGIEKHSRISYPEASSILIG